MGYEVHITKKKNWSLGGPDISGPEWMNYLSTDPELRMARPVAVTLSDGSTYQHSIPTLAKWMAHSSGYPVLFDYRDEHVVVRNPDAETISKMQKIAKTLGGRVQGDNGEFLD